MIEPDAEPPLASGDHARPPVVLLTTDTEWSARSFETLFDAHGLVVVRGTMDQDVMTLVATVRPDAVILEHRIPGLDALATLAGIHDDPRFSPGTPLIVVSSSPLDRAGRLALYTAGAWAYCTQPVDGEVLLRQLRTLITVKRRMDRLQDATLVEPLTGLYSPRGLSQRAREIAAGAFRRHEPLACIALTVQVEGRKRAVSPARTTVAAARALADEWRRVARGTDALGHLGAAEFGIIAAGTDVHGAQSLHRRLKAQVEAASLQLDGVTCHLRLFAEVAGVDDYAAAPVDALDLLRNASRALHFARSTGAVVPTEP